MKSPNLSWEGTRNWLKSYEYACVKSEPKCIISTQKLQKCFWSPRLHSHRGGDTLSPHPPPPAPSAPRLCAFGVHCSVTVLSFITATPLSRLSRQTETRCLAGGREKGDFDRTKTSQTQCMMNETRHLPGVITEQRTVYASQ